MAIPGGHQNGLSDATVNLGVNPHQSRCSTSGPSRSIPSPFWGTAPAATAAIPESLMVASSEEARPPSPIPRSTYQALAGSVHQSSPAMVAAASRSDQTGSSRDAGSDASHRASASGTPSNNGMVSLRRASSGPTARGRHTRTGTRRIPRPTVSGNVSGPPRGGMGPRHIFYGHRQSMRVARPPTTSGLPPAAAGAGARIPGPRARHRGGLSRPSSTG